MASPWLIALSSLLVPGAGQLWLGQRVKGAVILVGGSVLCCGFGVVNVFAAVDALVLARRVRAGNAIGPYESARVLDVLDGL